MYLRQYSFHVVFRMLKAKSVLLPILLFSIAASLVTLLYSSKTKDEASVNEKKDDIPHPCDRDCTALNLEPMTCVFNLVARDQFTADDPRRFADGRNRSVLTYNHQLPGPLLVVCQDDTVDVILDNQIKDGLEEGADGSTTLHLHGIRQVGRTDQNEMVFGPWADGVPFVTQCPISAKQMFRYTFKATKDNFNAPPGTYFYHSHVGSQRMNGLQGGFVIKAKYPYLFDDEEVIDDPKEFTVALQEWYESPAKKVPMSILVNGKAKLADKVFDGSNKTEINKFLMGIGGYFGYNELLGTIETNYKVFNIDQIGKNYRFRIIGTIAENFPIRISMDNVKFAAIATDTLLIEPIRNLTYLWIAAGERYDIIPDLSSSVEKAIKMRLISYTHLADSSTALCSIAWIKMPGSSVDEAYTAPHDCSDFPDHDNVFPTNSRVLNPPPVPGQFFQKIDDPYADVSQTGNIFPISFVSRHYEELWIPRREREESRQYIEFNPGTTLNGIRTLFPRTPYLLQDPELDIMTCDISNKESRAFKKYKPSVVPNDTLCFAETEETLCQHVLKFPFADTRYPNTSRSFQEVVLINNPSACGAHPMHKHGGWFWVVGEGQFDQSVDVNRDFIMNNFESLKQNFTNATMSTTWRSPDAGFEENGPRNTYIIPKDLIQVPNKGYVVIRVHLDNPGTFLFHCHIDSHLRHGMALGKYLLRF